MTYCKPCSALLMLAAASVVVGCHGPTSDLKVAAIADYSVVVDPPLVKVDRRADTTYISGTVHRQPGNNTEISGRVDIDFIAPDGDYILDVPLHCRLNPNKLPLDSNVMASYIMPWGVVYPPTTTVQVKFVDSVTAAKEDLEGTTNIGGVAGTGNRNGVHGGNTAIRTGGSNRSW